MNYFAAIHRLLQHRPHWHVRGRHGYVASRSFGIRQVRAQGADVLAPKIALHHQDRQVSRV
jgi:hypothetical protein